MTSYTNKNFKTKLTISTKFSKINSFPIIISFTNTHITVTLNLSEIKNNKEYKNNKSNLDILISSFMKLFHPLKINSKTNTVYINYLYINNIEYQPDTNKLKNSSHLNEVLKKITNRTMLSTNIRNNTHLISTNLTNQDIIKNENSTIVIQLFSFNFQSILTLAFEEFVKEGIFSNTKLSKNDYIDIINVIKTKRNVQNKENLKLFYDFISNVNDIKFKGNKYFNLAFPVIKKYYDKSLLNFLITEKNKIHYELNASNINTFSNVLSYNTTANNKNTSMFGKKNKSNSSSNNLQSNINKVINDLNIPFEEVTNSIYLISQGKVENYIFILCSFLNSKIKSNVINLDLKVNDNDVSKNLNCLKNELLVNKNSNINYEYNVSNNNKASNINSNLKSISLLGNLNINSTLNSNKFKSVSKEDYNNKSFDDNLNIPKNNIITGFKNINDKKSSDINELDYKKNLKNDSQNNQNKGNNKLYNNIRQEDKMNRSMDNVYANNNIQNKVSLMENLNVNPNDSNCNQNQNYNIDNNINENNVNINNNNQNNSNNISNIENNSCNLNYDDLNDNEKQYVFLLNKLNMINPYYQYYISNNEISCHPQLNINNQLDSIINNNFCENSRIKIKYFLNNNNDDLNNVINNNDYNGQQDNYYNNYNNNHNHNPNNNSNSHHFYFNNEVPHDNCFEENIRKQIYCSEKPVDTPKFTQKKINYNFNNSNSNNINSNNNINNNFNHNIANNEERTLDQESTNNHSSSHNQNNPENSNQNNKNIETNSSSNNKTDDEYLKELISLCEDSKSFHLLNPLNNIENIIENSGEVLARHIITSLYKDYFDSIFNLDLDEFNTLKVSSVFTFSFSLISLKKILITSENISKLTSVVFED